MKNKMFLCLTAILLSVISLMLSLSLLNGLCSGPYFINSDEALASDSEMQMINQRIALQDEILKKEEKVFNDSIAKLLDSLTVRRGEEEKLIDLMNMESNIFRHKKIDSIATASHVEVEKAINSFNERIKIFGQEKNISVLFGSNNNAVVYGSGTKADLTKELINFLGSENE